MAWYLGYDPNLYMNTNGLLSASVELSALFYGSRAEIALQNEKPADEVRLVLAQPPNQCGFCSHKRQKCVYPQKWQWHFWVWEIHYQWDDSVHLFQTENASHLCRPPCSDCYKSPWEPLPAIFFPSIFNALAWLRDGWQPPSRATGVVTHACDPGSHPYTDSALHRFSVLSVQFLSSSICLPVSELTML